MVEHRAAHHTCEGPLKQCQTCPQTRKIQIVGSNESEKCQGEPKCGIDAHVVSLMKAVNFISGPESQEQCVANVGTLGETEEEEGEGRITVTSHSLDSN